METKIELIHILLRESEKDGTKTEMKIMYTHYISSSSKFSIVIVLNSERLVFSLIPAIS